MTGFDMIFSKKIPKFFLQKLYWNFGHIQIFLSWYTSYVGTTSVSFLLLFGRWSCIFQFFFFHILGCKSNLQLPKNASLLKGASFISRTITANIAPHLSSFNGVYFCTFQIIFIYAPSPFITRLKRGYTSAGEVYLCRFYVYLRHVSEMTRGKDKCWICLWYFVSLFSWDI